MFHFYKTPDLLQKIGSDLIWKIPTTSKNIYLTFDDGPIPGLSEYVLEILDNFHAEATFFSVGDNIEKHPKIFEKLIEKGHSIGNHTFNHLKGWSTNNEYYYENIEKCQQCIDRYLNSGQRPLFRPPHGQITKNQISHLKEKYLIIMWEILAYDYDQTHTPQKSLDEIIRKTKPGSIVVFHDNFKAETKMKYILRRYVKHFVEQGFQFKKIDGVEFRSTVN